MKLYIWTKNDWIKIDAVKIGIKNNEIGDVYIA